MVNFIRDLLFFFEWYEKMCAEKRPNARDAGENLKSSMPFARKLWLIMRNSAMKIIRMRSCCGHPGEPGC